MRRLHTSAYNCLFFPELGGDADFHISTNPVGKEGLCYDTEDCATFLRDCFAGNDAKLLLVFLVEPPVDEDRSDVDPFHGGEEAIYSWMKTHQVR